MGPLGTFSRLSIERFTGIKFFTRLRKKEMKPNLSFQIFTFINSFIKSTSLKRNQKWFFSY